MRVRWAALTLLLSGCPAREQPPRPALSSAAGTSSNTVTPRTAPAPSVSSTVGSTPAPDDSRAISSSAEQCRTRCNGRWGPHGMAGVPSCLCRTGDNGKACRDRADCEGACIFDPQETEVLDPGPPPRGYFGGKCSEFVTAFGCLRRISKGARAAGPVDLQQLPPKVCID